MLQIYDEDIHLSKNKQKEHQLYMYLSEFYFQSCSCRYRLPGDGPSLHRGVLRGTNKLEGLYPGPRQNQPPNMASRRV